MQCGKFVPVKKLQRLRRLVKTLRRHLRLSIPRPTCVSFILLVS